MVIGFKNQFVEPILNGSKIHTIREDSHNRWVVGRRMDMATGVRTKNYNKFSEKICLGIQTIEIKWYFPPSDSFAKKSVQVFIDGKNVSHKDRIIDSLVRNDGFKDRRDFFEWFSDDYKGKIIHWTKKKY
jgi:hypothetical protein